MAPEATRCYAEHVWKGFRLRVEASELCCPSLQGYPCIIYKAEETGVRKEKIWRHHLGSIHTGWAPASGFYKPEFKAVVL